MEKFSVTRLIGAPPGYVGYEEGGQLTEAVRRKPYSVILLDEIEKAHPDIFNALLQVLDDGRLTDSHGRTVDFKNALLIMTSNVGARRILELSERIGLDGEEKVYDQMRRACLDELHVHFRPEFLNRVDEIIVFHPLSREDLLRIVELLLDEVRGLLKEQGIGFEIDAAAKELLVRQGYDPRYGARPLRRTIARLLTNELAGMILDGRYSSGDTVKVGVEGGALAFS